MGCVARVALCVATATCGLAGSHFAGEASPAAGAVYAWGTYSWGTSLTMPVGDTPTAIAVPSGHVTQVAASNSAAYALTSGGAVYAWGDNTFGEFGNGTTGPGGLSPEMVDFPAGVTIAALAPDTSPFSSAVAIDTTGHAWVWGFAGASACQGAATQSKYLTPVEVPLSNVTQAAGALSHALYLSNGTLYACGRSEYGDLGDGSTMTKDVPVKVRVPGRVQWIGASWHDSAALTSRGYFDWGYNAAGQLGDGTTTDSDLPVRIELPSPVKMAAIGGSESDNGQTILLLKDGQVMVWGNGTYGQLGNGAGDAVGPIPFAVPARPSVIASGGGTLYLVIAGNLYSIGENDGGQAGSGTSGSSVTRLTEIQAGVKSVAATALDAVSLSGG
jgi:alpha-tubulin suppressor-like RCC1 family protein